MKFISAAVVGALLLVSLAVPFANQASAASEDSTVPVLFDFGNGQILWADVNLTSSMDSFNATEQAATALGLDMTAQNWGNETNPNMFIDTINGLGFDMATYAYWGFWTWNMSMNSWQMASVGPSAVKASDAGAIAWLYTPTSDAPLATPEHRYPWASFRHDSMNTGSQLDLTSTNLASTWQRNLSNGAIDAPIIAAGGYEYVVTGGILNMTTWGYDSDSTVFCLNSTGATVWSASIGTGYQVGAPLIVGDMVVVPSANGKVYAFGARNGTLLWTFNTGSALNTGITSSPVAYLDHIIVAAGNGKLFSLYRNGSQDWNMTIAPVVSTGYDAKAIYSSTPAIRNGTIYIGSVDGRLHAVAANGSAELWTVRLGNETKGSPLLLDDMMVITYMNKTGSVSSGGLAAVDYDGNMLWQTPTGTSPASPALTEAGFAVATADGLSMIGPDGELLWSRSLGTAFPGAAPTAIGNLIFMVTNEERSRVVAVNMTGDVVWQQALLPDQYALCPPTVVDDTLLVASDNGLLYAFDLNAQAEGPSNPTNNEGFPLWAVGLIVVVVVVAVGAVYLVTKKK